VPIAGVWKAQEGARSKVDQGRGLYVPTTRREFVTGLSSGSQVDILVLKRGSSKDAQLRKPKQRIWADSCLYRSQVVAHERMCLHPIASFLFSAQHIFIIRTWIYLPRKQALNVATCCRDLFVLAPALPSRLKGGRARLYCVQHRPCLVRPLRDTGGVIAAHI
jgi:hypothetical protein